MSRLINAFDLMNKMGNVSVIVKKFSSPNKLISDLVTLFTASGLYVMKLFHAHLNEAWNFN